LREYGPSYLGNSELIAILLRIGSEGENVLTLASRVLSTFNGLGGLGKATYGALCNLHSISEAKACPLLAALELGRRLTSLQPEDRAVIRSPQDVFNLAVPALRIILSECGRSHKFRPIYIRR